MKSRGGGYTILEVLIFVAMTSVLLIVAIANINGGRRQVEFTQSVRDFESQLQDTINDVPTGYFPTDGAIACDATLSGSPSITAGTSDLGTDDTCLYIGKALQFSPDNSSNRNRIRIYPLAGRRYIDSTTTPVTDIDEAQPAAVALPAGGDSVQEIVLRNGVYIDRVFNGDASTPPVAADEYGLVSILTNFEGTAPSGNVSDVQSVQIGGIQGSTFGLNKTDAITNYMNTMSSATFQAAENGIVLCLIDDSDKRASLTIGATGSGSVKLDIDSYNVGCNP